MSINMSNMIKSVKITQLFGNTDIEWQLQKTNVLVGKNGMGKSTILQLIIDTITQELHENSNVSLFLKTYLITDLGNEFLMDAKNTNDFLKFLYEHMGVLNEDVIIGFLESMDWKINESSMLEFYPKKEFAEKIHHEFVSTVNLNANSVQNIAMGDGSVKNMLNWSIKNELNRLLEIKDDELNNKFLSSLNEMFKESNKKAYFNSDGELEFLFHDKKLYFTNLSSGERQVIYIFLKVAIATKNNALILMDEPEISLHLSWQEKLLTQIRAINPDSQLIIVTHSPAIVMNGWLDCFVDIKDIMVKGDV